MTYMMYGIYTLSSQDLTEILEFAFLLRTILLLYSCSFSKNKTTQLTNLNTLKNRLLIQLTTTLHCIQRFHTNQLHCLTHGYGTGLKKKKTRRHLLVVAQNVHSSIHGAETLAHVSEPSTNSGGK